MGNGKPIILVALGGNAMIKKGQTGTIEEQFENLRLPVSRIAALSRDYRLIITHGNGPQVGNLLLQQESCTNMLPRLPLEILVAQTEGQIGYMIESSLDTELMAQGIAGKHLVSLITYVVVDENDPAFKDPKKPIGPVYEPDRIAGLPFPVAETAKGFRRIVASPRPKTIVEKREISKLIDMDFIVICCGGGGIPVIRKQRRFQGVDAVIDKDLASACLGLEVGVDILVMATDVEGAYLNYGKENQKLIGKVDRDQAGEYMRSGHFRSGSMQPKVEAAMEFVAGGGKKAVITSLENILEAVESDQVGTQIF